ncbi:MAG: FecR domain-containing protein [Lentisphaeraceae bacterium]|nr:FecR domain-containing protein [Lentisphaeraceae bacterium]
MNRDDLDLIYGYLNGSLNEYQTQKFESRMRDDAFTAEFVKFVTDEEIIQRALSEIEPQRSPVISITRFFKKAITLSAAAAAIYLCFFFYDMINYQATLSSFKGDLSISRNGNIVKLEKGVKIKSGDILESKDGTCTFKYKDKTTLRLEPNSRILISSQSSSKLVEIKKGSVYSSVTPQQPGSEMIIKTISGFAKILGTKFTITALNTSMKLDVIKGAVLLENNTGEKAVVRDGEYAIARDNVPVEVLKTPVQSEIKEDEEKFYKWLSYSTKIRNDKDLVAYYDFQGVADTTPLLSNKASHTKNLPLNGKVANAIPVQGRWILKEAMYFNGNASVDCGNNPSFSIQNQITIFAWVKSLKFKNSQETLISKGDSSWRLARYKMTNGIEMAGTGLNPSSWTIGNRKVDDGKWHLVTGVYDGQKISLYIDGRLDSSTQASGKLNTNDFNVSIGFNSAYNERYFNGWIDELGIFKRALSQTEIQQIYKSGTP